MVFLISTDEKAHAVKIYMSKLWVGIYISVVECFGGQYHVNKMVKHEKVLRMSHDCKKCILRHITELQFKLKKGNVRCVK